MTVDNSDGRPRAVRHSPAVVTAAAVVVAVLVVAVLVWVLGPGAVWVLHRLDGINGKTLSQKDKADALDAIRGRVITIATGILAIVAVYYTARNAHNARRTLEHSEESARRTAELTEQGQVTERYTKAIEQLGSDKLDIRIGGIYALERIARDSARDRPTIIEVLAAFVREHSHDEDGHAPAPADLLADVGRLRPDLQAALTVIGRRTTDHRAVAASIDLNNADLRLADLVDARLTDARLTGAYLTTRT
jgi:hypothetical protein